MAKRGPQTHHVVPNSSRGGWDVVKGGAHRAGKHFENKSDAINWGRTVSRNQSTEFRIHRSDGKISRSDSHGNDPCPPKDKR